MASHIPSSLGLTPTWHHITSFFILSNNARPYYFCWIILIPSLFISSTCSFSIELCCILSHQPKHGSSKRTPEPCFHLYHPTNIFTNLPITLYDRPQISSPLVFGIPEASLVISPSAKYFRR